MKKIHRFLIKEPIKGASIEVDDPSTIHIIKNVLKLSIGEECIVFNDKGNDYLSSIVSVDKKLVTLKVLSTVEKKNIPKNITACISIIKHDNFELIVQKLTEIGIQTIVPIVSDRTVKQSIRIDRLQKISDEALEQSGGSSRVLIKEPQTLENALKERANLSQYCFEFTGEKLASTNEKEAVFYIGPEGGWSNSDLQLFKDYGAHFCSLGDKVLRAETATIIAGYKLLWD